MPVRIHIVGASGSGTTTLGRALASRLGCPHVDTDDYFWLPSDPPFQDIRPRDERCARLETALRSRSSWVLSGCLCGWGDGFIPLFDLVVFLWLPRDVRVSRLRIRERERYGEPALAPGGRMHAGHVRFMTWAAAYDDGGLDTRSRRLHDAWLAGLPCPVLRLSSLRPPDALIGEVMAHLSDTVGAPPSVGSGPRTTPPLRPSTATT